MAASLETDIPSGYAEGDQYFATRYRQGGRRVYSIDLSPAQITTTIDPPQPGVLSRTNREISEKHADEFSEYIIRNPKRVIPPLLLHVPIGTMEFQQERVLGETAFGLLTIPRLAREDVQILDGQHRILGMHKAMAKLSDEIRQRRSLRSQTHTETDEGVRIALEQSLSSEITELEQKRRVLGEERVTLQIVEIDNETEIRQMFADIADNAKGITQAIRARFDQTRLVNRVMTDLMEEHPLLAGRVDEQHDRLSGSNPNLVGAQHVSDAVRTILVGISGRVSVRRESEVHEREVKKDVLLFLDSLVDGFSDYKAIVEGTVTPPELRSRSLLGSHVMFRVLAGVFHDVTMDGDTRPEREKVAEVVELFRSLQPWMALPASWAPGSPWRNSEAVPEGARSSQSRKQSFRELVTLITAWPGGEVPTS
jgi:hypothetical protein